MAIFEELGIPRVVNANATLTRLGGSRLAPGVAEAMAEAGQAFVDLPDEIRIRDRVADARARSAADHLHEQDQSEEDADPDEEALHPGVRRLFLVHSRLVSGLAKPVRCKGKTPF